MNNTQGYEEYDEHAAHEGADATWDGRELSFFIEV